MRSCSSAVELMAKQEVRAARLVQRRWRGSRNREAAYAEALLKIQAVAKGHQERARIRAERQWAAESEKQRKAVEKARLVSECTAIIEKLGRRYALGPWEMAVWQERSVVCTDDALLYQHVKSNAAPTGVQKSVPFASIRAIKALPGGVLLLECATRDYHFQLSSADETERWATNLVQLAEAAGHHVPGFMVMAPDAATPGGAPDGAPGTSKGAG